MQNKGNIFCSEHRKKLFIKCKPSRKIYQEGKNPTTANAQKALVVNQKEKKLN
jgi:hypothetical protein